ncbi:glycerophosphodiester phosphodiesterase [Cellulomonas dongxiuzhuiae]|uniref:Glycerophosphodiester phosphodiesterase n=1 Tax=Cellulomonas dongxiuzhuiae TaxID=2819979 RepID=A0ABX8GQK0_9CELL|nr:glycerophosphodiester phosphodiesterase [Cellulomonas dongxiuzhuiae]MBO3094966.1 glycerophosphodiester phosphodiesterase [Cellulomonas dongxiuzhuiae]QWC18026.1 glycerophosphodiester phosphodiesterase [Cellulomonas dongxiuzhuiae]
MTRVVAHRGSSWVAPQNTLAAFESAARAGADAIELDVQLTADGHVVVIHDDTLDATTSGSGRLDGTTLAEVRALDAGSWFSPAYAGQRVPVLEEVVDLLLRHPSVDLLCEVKGEWTPEEAARVTRPLRDAGLASRVVVQSFSPRTVAALREADPGLRRGLLLEDVGGDVLDVCAALDVRMANPHGRAVLRDPGLVARLHDAGLQVAVWTLNDVAHWSAAVELGVDEIITDRPDRLAGWLAARG